VSLSGLEQRFLAFNNDKKETQEKFTNETVWANHPFGALTPYQLCDWNENGVTMLGSRMAGMGSRGVGSRDKKVELLQR